MYMYVYMYVYMYMCTHVRTCLYLQRAKISERLKKAGGEVTVTLSLLVVWLL